MMRLVPLLIAVVLLCGFVQGEIRVRRPQQQGTSSINNNNRGSTTTDGFVVVGNDAPAQFTLKVAAEHVTTKDVKRVTQSTNDGTNNLVKNLKGATATAAKKTAAQMHSSSSEDRDKTRQYHQHLFETLRRQEEGGERPSVVASEDDHKEALEQAQKHHATPQERERLLQWHLELHEGLRAHNAAAAAASGSGTSTTTTTTTSSRRRRLHIEPYDGPKVRHVSHTVQYHRPSTMKRASSSSTTSSGSRQLEDVDGNTNGKDDDGDDSNKNGDNYNPNQGDNEAYKEKEKENLLKERRAKKRRIERRHQYRAAASTAMYNMVGDITQERGKVAVNQFFVQDDNGKLHSTGPVTIQQESEVQNARVATAKIREGTGTIIGMGNSQTGRIMDGTMVHVFGATIESSILLGATVLRVNVGSDDGVNPDFVTSGMLSDAHMVGGVLKDATIINAQYTGGVLTGGILVAGTYTTTSGVVVFDGTISGGISGALVPPPTDNEDPNTNTIGVGSAENAIPTTDTDADDGGAEDNGGDVDNGTSDSDTEEEAGDTGTNTIATNPDQNDDPANENTDSI